MLTQKAIFMLVMVLSMATVIYAQSKGTIVFARRPNFIDPVTGESPDMTWIHVLEDEGYEVIQFFNASLSTAEQATLDTLNNANLVIIGRSVPTIYLGGNNAADKIAWNSITKPILTGNMWAMRSTRLNWFNTTSISGPVGVDSTTVHNAIIEIPDDPVFEGLDTSGPVPWAIGLIDVLGTEDGGYGLVLARTETAPHNVLFVRFEPYEEFYDGANDYPEGYRTYIGNGRDASSQPPFNYFPFTEESKKVLLAEVARMVALGGGGTAVEDQANTTIPSTSVLFQNYPNPFNPTTTIPFSLPEKCYVRLVLLNVLGEVVKEIASGEYGAGYHEVMLDAGNLATGVYFYKIETGGFTDMKKLVIIK